MVSAQQRPTAVPRTSTPTAVPHQRTASERGRGRGTERVVLTPPPPGPPDGPGPSVDGVGGTDDVSLPSLTRMLIDAGAMFSHAGPLARAGRTLGVELVKVGSGSSALAPDPKDGRFKDPTWSQNGAYRRVAQSYLAGCAFVDELIESQAKKGRSTAGAKFAMNLVTSAAAPTNVIAGNPAALKRAFETGGRSLLRGGRNWVGDLRHNGGMPSTVDKSALKVGRDLAMTPGRVIDRNEFGEVLQFTPTTDVVRRRPVLVIPPPIGRYYFLDLAPRRSFVEYSVGRGLQTYMLSWRNPTTEHRAWNMDDYAQRILDAIDVVCEVTGSQDVDLIGFCAGGILQTLVLNYLAARGDTRVASASYGVTLLDFAREAPIRAFSAPRLLSAARRNSARSGVISAREMGLVFNLMRPNDLIWNYWVNNYLLGEPPPVFDVLAWNADGTNLPAALHQQFLELFDSNALCARGLIRALDTPLDAGQIKVPVFVTGAMTDHITPWAGCYRTTQILSGEATFVLSNAGHIQSLVNPPGNPKASYFAGPQPGPDAHEWLEQAEQRPGTWWEPWADWLLARCDEVIVAPATLGSAQHPAMESAPGLYVRDLTA